jgi:uncharacterized protein YndB with AHSA1/START domain
MTSIGTAVVTLPTSTQILITREFDAPRHLVYRAWTTPDLIKQWWSGDRGKVTSIEVDLRVGGAWRYVMIANGGFEVAFHGEYLELVGDERIVSTEVFEAMPDHPAVSTLVLTETGQRTTINLLVDHTSQSDRDMHIASGMEGGLQEALDHLEQVARAVARSLA